MFRTPISLTPEANPIRLNSKMLALGSCFADFMGVTMREHKFNLVTNPLGVIYHPLSLFRILEMARSGDLPPEESYLQTQEIHYNYFFHGQISHTTREGLEELITNQLKKTAEQLKKLDFLLLTFGTALQYVHRETGLVVANCHKIPQAAFDKSLTSVDVMVKAFSGLISNWGPSPPHIILSVSPIRHIKEGLLANSVSKSVLRVACEEIINNFQGISYFPGFEIMIDDLRDYRYFSSDMVHPNETAQSYLWDLFVKNYLDDNARQFVDDWKKITRNLRHQAFHPHTHAYQQFLRKTLDLIKKLPPDVDTREEVAFIHSKLI